jgi:hypothetical protein
MSNSEIDISQVIKSGFNYDSLYVNNKQFTDSFLKEIKQNKYDYFLSTHIPTFEIFNYDHNSLCEILRFLYPDKRPLFIRMFSSNIIKNKYKDEIFLQLSYDLAKNHNISNYFYDYHYSKINDKLMITYNWNEMLSKTINEYIKLYPISKLFIIIKINNYNINTEFIEKLINHMYPNIYNELQLSLISKIIYYNKFKKYIILQLIINIANINKCCHFINIDIINDLLKKQHLIFAEMNQIF